MTKTTRREMLSQIDRITRVLGGETVDGITLGMAGITREWLEQTRDDLARTVTTGEFRR